MCILKHLRYDDENKTYLRILLNREKEQKTCAMFSVNCQPKLLKIDCFRPLTLKQKLVDNPHQIFSYGMIPYFS